MSNPAYLVEGHMEQLFLGETCHHSTPIVRIGTNGDDVEIATMGKFIDTKIRLFGNRYYPIVIIFDREKRKATCEEIREELYSFLHEQGHRTQIEIAVADRTIENWILADGQAVSDHYEINLEEEDYEGGFGKSQLKKRIDGKDYSETTDGVDMLKRSRASKIAEKSASFRVLFDALDLDCWWLST